MNFVDLVFVPFLLLVLLALRVAKGHEARVIVLLIFSYVFYGWWRLDYLWLIIGSSTVDYLLAGFIAGARTQRAKRGLLVVSLVSNLGLLAYFKYTNFFVRTTNDLATLLGQDPIFAREWDILLPAGISFYTFQSLSYTIDVYRGHIQAEKHPIHFLCFVAAFPQLVAGPIVRAVDFLPQIKSDFYERRSDSGLFLIFYGLAKKLLLADLIGKYLVDPVYADPSRGSKLDLILCAYGYSFQIFLDFSAYSDIAIGVGRLLGLEFMKNFRAPYLATSLSDFWRRWHISLSTWFRDYLYFPMGGNRTSPGRNALAIGTVFLLSGLWHGANLTFVFWGALHGVGLIAERLLGVGPPKDRRRAFLRALVTFHVVTLSWVFFRSQTIGSAITFLELLGSSSWSDGRPTQPFVWVALAAAAATHATIEPRIEEVTAGFAKMPLVFRAALFFLMGTVAYGLSDLDMTHAAFIYFQF